MSIYREHRQRFLATLCELDAAALIPTNSAKTRSNDTEYRFRPSSDFWYLTGFAEPESWLLLLPGAGGGRSVLFLRERDVQREIWDGKRLGVEAAPEALGVDEAHDVEDLWSMLPELLAGQDTLMWATGLDAEDDRAVNELLSLLRTRARGGVRAPAKLLHPGPYLHEQRLLKSAGEIEVMRRAAAVTDEAHRAVMAAAAPGVNECELDALLDYTFRRRGGTGAAYNNIVAGGANACILHYVENDQPLADGSLCLVDAGTELEHYASDVTRTFPVSGTFTEPQRRVYEVVLAAQLAAIAKCRPGVPFDEVHEASLEVLIDGMLKLGLCKGTREEILESGAYRQWYMHRTSHWLGLDVHDCGGYDDANGSRPLEPGMVLTVEPGLYIAPDAEGAPEELRGIGVRIEDDILITADGHENLTAAVPKTLDEVEAACRA